MKMFEFLKRVLGSYNAFRLNRRWKLEYEQLVAKSSTEEITLLPAQEGRILLVVPHADDELFGAHALTTHENVLLCYCGFTGENVSIENQNIRRKEFESYVKKMKVDAVFPHNLSAELPKIIEEYHISTILLPSLIDWHNEHRLVNYLTLKACKERDIKPNILWYSVSIPIMAQSKCIVPMTEEQQSAKYRIFREIYKSQKHMPLVRFQLSECLAASASEIYSAESYLPLSYEIWASITKRVCIAEGIPEDKMLREIKLLKTKLSSIVLMREVSKELYTEIMAMSSN